MSRLSSARRRTRSPARNCPIRLARRISALPRRPTWPATGRRTNSTARRDRVDDVGDDARYTPRTSPYRNSPAVCCPSRDGPSPVRALAARRGKPTIAGRRRASRPWRSRVARDCSRSRGSTVRLTACQALYRQSRSIGGLRSAHRDMHYRIRPVDTTQYPIYHPRRVSRSRSPRDGSLFLSPARPGSNDESHHMSTAR